MKRYKVVFENNIPVFARPIEVEPGFDATEIDISEFKKEGGKTFIQSLNIKGFNEIEAIEKARKVVRNIWR